MKALLLLSVFSLPLLLTGCETTVVTRHPAPRRVAYVERDVVVAHPRPRRNVVVVNPRPVYSPQVQVRYYNDHRGRYYIKSGRRIYVNAGVRY